MLVGSLLNKSFLYHLPLTHIQSAWLYSSLLPEKAFLGAAFSDGDSQEVHGDICHGHCVQTGETGGPGRGRARGLVAGGLGLRGGDGSLLPGQTEILRLVSLVFCGAAGPRNRPPGQTSSPVLSLVHIWRTERAAVKQTRVPPRAAVLGRYRGLLLKPPGQLDEAVIRRLSAVEQASGRAGHTVRPLLLRRPPAFGVRLILVVM